MPSEQFDFFETIKLTSESQIQQMSSLEFDFFGNS